MFAMTHRESIVLAVGLLAVGCVVNAPDGGDPSGSDPGGDTGGGSGAGDPYSWASGGFGACSAACGGGVSVRTVTCVDSSGTPVADGLCTDPKPEVSEACNMQSCSNINCTPVLDSYSTVVTAKSPTIGPGPLTVTFNLGIQSTFAWDVIDFGDGSVFPAKDLVFQNLPGPNGGGAFACVNHTFTAPGSYNVGRNLAGGNPQYYPTHEVAVTVQ